MSVFPNTTVQCFNPDTSETCFYGYDTLACCNSSIGCPNAIQYICTPPINTCASTVQNSTLTTFFLIQNVLVCFYNVNACTYDDVTGTLLADDFGGYCPLSVEAPCPIGYYLDNSNILLPGICSRCGPGTFSNTTNSNSCTACTSGQYDGSYGVGECTQCPPNSYAPAISLPQCLPCPLGSDQQAYGSSTCNLCDNGYYNNVSGSSCLPCSDTTVTFAPGSITCSVCDIGFFVSNNTCTPCPVNTTSFPSGNVFTCSISCADIDPSFVSSGFGGPCFNISVLNVVLAGPIPIPPSPNPSYATLVALLIVFGVILLIALLVMLYCASRREPRVVAVGNSNISVSAMYNDGRIKMV